MWLVLCTSDDHPALWAAERLRARGLTPLVVLTPELLHHSFEWQHRLDNDHPPSVAFTLADRRRIRGEAIRGVLNRIAALPPRLVEALPPSDRAYALQEWAALHISWLSSLPAPVLNLPVIHGLCGAWRHQSQWTWLASRAGLRTSTFRADPGRRAGSDTGLRPVASRDAAPRNALGNPSLRTVCVVDGVAVDESLQADVRAACGRLGSLAATRLIGITIDGATGTFVGASPRPDLRVGGEPLIEVLHGVFSSRG